MRDPMNDSMQSNDEARWLEFVAEARALIAIAPDQMSAEQLERLEAISDALIHLTAYVESQRPSGFERDLRLIKELARRNERKRWRSLPARSESPDVILS